MFKFRLPGLTEFSSNTDGESEPNDPEDPYMKLEAPKKKEAKKDNLQGTCL